MLNIDAVEATVLAYLDTDTSDITWPEIRQSFLVHAADPMVILEMVEEIKAKRSMLHKEMQLMTNVLAGLVEIVEHQALAKGTEQERVLNLARQILGLNSAAKRED